MKDPFVFNRIRVVVEDRIGGVYDGFGAAFDANAKLKRRQVFRRICRSLPRDALRRPTAQRITDDDWAMTSGLFQSGNGFGDSSGGEKVYDARHGGEESVSAVG